MQPKFRIRNKDIEKLKKLNRSTQRKERRLNKLFDITINNPLKKIDQFSSRKEFNQYVKDLESFTDYKSHRYVKNTKGLVVERELYTDIQKAVRNINKQNQKTLNEIRKQDHTDRGNKTGWSVDDAMYKMGDPRLNRYRVKRFNFDAFESEQDLINYLNMTNKQADPKRRAKSDKMLKKNYMKALKSVFDSDADHIVEAVRRTPLNKFLYIFYTENVADFDFIYSFQSRIVKLIQLAQIWGVKATHIEFLEGML